MTTNDKMAKLKLLLCEMKLEQRHLNTDLANLLKQNQPIDFFQARNLNKRKNNLAKKIDNVESSINPNIIA